LGGPRPLLLGTTLVPCGVAVPPRTPGAVRVSGALGYFARPSVTRAVSLLADQRDRLPVLVRSTGSGARAAIAVGKAVDAGGQTRGLLGLVQRYIGVETGTPLAWALVVGAVDAPAKNGTALEALALILEPVLGPAAPAVDLHLGPLLLRRNRDRHASSAFRERGVRRRLSSQVCFPLGSGSPCPFLSHWPRRVSAFWLSRAAGTVSCWAQTERYAPRGPISVSNDHHKRPIRH